MATESVLSVKVTPTATQIGDQSAPVTESRKPQAVEALVASVPKDTFQKTVAASRKLGTGAHALHQQFLSRMVTEPKPSKPTSVTTTLEPTVTPTPSKAQSVGSDVSVPSMDPREARVVADQLTALVMGYALGDVNAHPCESCKTPEIRTYSAPQLEAWVVKVIHERAPEITPEEATLFARAIVGADVDGYATHGLGRLKFYLDKLGKSIDTSVRLTDKAFVEESRTQYTLDAGHGLGQVAMSLAVNKAMRVASEVGMAEVVVQNSNHFGTVTHYLQKLAAAGFAGHIMTTSNPLVGPTGFGTPVFGTNPIGMVFPGGFIMDMATSPCLGKIQAAARLGKPVPDGVTVRGAEGIITDAAVAEQRIAEGTAAIQYDHDKLAALGTFEEIIVGALSGNFSRDARKNGVGHVIFVRKCRHVEVERAKEFATSLEEQGRQAHVSVRIPGHNNRTVTHVMLGVPVSAEVLEEVQKLAPSIALPTPIDR